MPADLPPAATADQTEVTATVVVDTDRDCRRGGDEPLLDVVADVHLGEVAYGQGV